MAFFIFNINSDFVVKDVNDNFSFHLRLNSRPKNHKSTLNQVFSFNLIFEKKNFSLLIIEEEAVPKIFLDTFFVVFLNFAFIWWKLI